ncbi:hypothetical protein [Niallia sp. 03133]|uniref:hypothetical protein n=1 Tax=Niallia sp. 03133 TaxID=3458060 RepID=UPI004044ACB7
MPKISLETFEKTIKNNNSGLIIGNGFSMNFDPQFGNIYDSLKEGIFSIYKYGNFSISPDAKPITRQTINHNYKTVLNYVRSMNQQQLEKIFEDGVVFAAFITENQHINNYLKNNKHILDHFKIGQNMLEITANIYRIGKLKGFKYVNIEHWPILIWLYNLIEFHEEFKTFKKSPNKFISILTIGGTKSIFPKNSPGDVMNRTRFNGFYILYRLLMITIIFGKGKAIDKNKLKFIDSISTSSLSDWLSNFKTLFSMNYDQILSHIAGRPVTYLHGRFEDKKQGFTYFQSYALTYNDTEYYSNNIILGDYQTSKVLDHAIHSLVMKNFLFTEPAVETLKELQAKMNEFNLNHIVFFGMNPENDYHILSGIYYNFLQSKIQYPTITFCYYNENEIDDFITIFHQSIHSIYKNTQYQEQITLNFVVSKEIICNYIKKEQTANL